MIITTTHTLDGHTITRYLGVVSGEVIIGANVFRDLAAGIRNLIGGRTKAYEDAMREARVEAIQEMSQRAQELGARAVVGVSLNYETVGSGMLMVTATGTAINYE